MYPIEFYVVLFNYIYFLIRLFYYKKVLKVFLSLISVVNPSRVIENVVLPKSASYGRTFSSRIMIDIKDPFYNKETLKR